MLAVDDSIAVGWMRTHTDADHAQEHTEEHLRVVLIPERPFQRVQAVFEPPPDPGKARHMH
jgi:hypothetical protein